MTRPDVTYRDSRAAFAEYFHVLAKRKNIPVIDALILPEQAEQHDSPDVFEHPESPTLIVPGLLGNSVRSLVAPLMCARERLTVKGYRTEVVWVSGRAGCDHNARILRDKVRERADHYGEAINLVGYSKGCTDSMTMLGQYPDTHSAVRSLTSLVGVVHGTPHADGVAAWLNALFRYLPLPGEQIGDGLAINDLRRDVRSQWLSEHPLPDSVRYATIAASPDPARVSRVLRGGYQQLARVNPDNDSQVITRDAILPNSELLAVLNADHWAAALPIAERHPRLGKLLVDRNTFPREILLQALIDWLS